MNLTYLEDYWEESVRKAEFVSFLNDIHNLDLTRWDEAGFWDKKYRPFSCFDGPTLASNVCVYTMKLTVDGRPCRAAQISAVGTRPEYRRRGLGRELTEKAMAWARESHEFLFLFADEEAFPFYRKCGFLRVDEYKARITARGSKPRPGAVRLDVGRPDHLALIDRIAGRRTPVSVQLGVNNRRLFMFWCLYFLRDHIYHILELDLLVLCKHEAEVLTVFDIVGQHIPAFADIFPYIRNESDRAVEFLFMPDRLGLKNSDWVRVTENGTHVLGEFPFVNGRFIFPLTAHA